MANHKLKTDPTHFKALKNGDKTFEIRFNDRGYSVGDILDLWETEAEHKELRAGKEARFTNNWVRAEVTHMLVGPCFGLAEGWAILSLRLLASNRQTGDTPI